MRARLGACSCSFPPRAEEPLSIFAVERERVGQHGGGVTTRPLNDATLQVADQARANAGALGQLFLGQAPPAPPLFEELPER